MLVKFSVKNFKNFKEKVILDFSNVSGYQFNEKCIINQSNLKLIGKMLIIGENAVGKTNLGEALLNLPRMLFSRLYKRRNSTNILNKDGDGDTCEFSYIFLINGLIIKYLYNLDEDYNVVNEKFYVSDKLIFENKSDCELKVYESSQMLIDINLYNGYKKNVLGSYDLMDNSESSTPFKNLSFLQYLAMSDTGNSILKSLFNFLFNMTIQKPDNSSLIIERYDDFLKSLYEDNNELKKLEMFFKNNNIYCELDVKKIDRNYELYFKHKKGDILFWDAASSGTKKLYQLYRKVYNSRASFIYLDEFDAFYHYELSRNVVKFLISYMPNVQIILTSHNTNLINNELLRPDCIKIISKKGIMALSQSTNRELREGHNLEKMYISGEFE